MNLRSLLSLSALALLGAADAASGQGTTLYGLTSTGSQIVTVNSANPSVTTGSALNVTGILAGETLYSIDFRPLDGQLYGLSSNFSGTGASTLYTINLQTGAATIVGTPSGIALGANATPVIDFNPTVDRIRVIGGNGSNQTNLRLFPNVGATPGAVVGGMPDTALAYAAGDPNAGATPNVQALAYTNSFAGATSTTLYGVDVSTRSLVRIGGLNGTPSPNGGAISTVGSLGIFFQSDAIGFEILGDGQAFLVAAAGVPAATDGAPLNSLYSVNLATGATTFLGSFAANSGAAFTSLTAVPVPEPSTVALVAAAGALGVARAVRRRRQEA